ncbi:hypothetical protein AVDCRST_MAG84-3393, partial [uncultured Microcoleus sp.]
EFYVRGNFTRTLLERRYLNLRTQNTPGSPQGEKNNLSSV